MTIIKINQTIFTIKLRDHSIKEDIANQWIADVIKMNDTEMINAPAVNNMLTASTNLLYSFIPIQYAKAENISLLILKWLEYLHTTDFDSPQLTDEQYQSVQKIPIIDMSDVQYLIFSNERTRRIKQERHNVHIDNGCEYLAVAICNTSRWSDRYIGAVFAP